MMSNAARAKRNGTAAPQASTGPGPSTVQAASSTLQSMHLGQPLSTVLPVQQPLPAAAPPSLTNPAPGLAPVSQPPMHPLVHAIPGQNLASGTTCYWHLGIKQRSRPTLRIASQMSFHSVLILLSSALSFGLDDSE